MVKLKSGVLYYVVFLLFIIWIICLGIMLVWKLNFVVFTLNDQQNRLTDDLRSTLSYVCSNPDTFIYKKTIQFHLFDDSISKSEVSVKNWFFYSIANIKVIIGKKQVHKSYLLGVDCSKLEQIALYMADENKYLTICGNSELRGTCYLPKLGIKRGYIEGRTYTGKQLTYGAIKVSNSRLPFLNKQIISKVESYIKEFMPDSLSDSIMNEQYLNKNRYINNSFYNKTICIASNKPLKLSNKSLKGNIIIMSSKSMYINRNCNFENIVIIAPKITIQDGFNGQLQVIATDTLVIGKKCYFKYPSSISIINVNINNCFVQLNERTRLDGIIYVYQEKKAQKQPFLRIENQVIVNGQVYCNGQIGLKGNINGSLYCKSFQLETRSSIFENHLLDNKINRIKLSSYFAGINLSDSTKYNFRVISCLK